MAGSAHPGTAAKEILRAIEYVQNADAPKVPPVNGLVGTNPGALPVPVSKIYADGGARVAAILDIAKRGQHRTWSKTVDGVWQDLEDYLQYCTVHQIPPTIGLFAAFCGISYTRLDQIARDKARNPEMAETVLRVKEVLRGILETAAIDGAVNPIVFFHANKVYFGAVETPTVHIHADISNILHTDEAEYADDLAEIIEVTDADMQEDG